MWKFCEKLETYLIFSLTIMTKGGLKTHELFLSIPVSGLMLFPQWNS